MPSKHCNEIIKQALQDWHVRTPVLKAIKKATCSLVPAPVKKKTMIVIVDDKKDDKKDDNETN